MRPRTKEIFTPAEIQHLQYYGFAPRKGRYLCAFAKDCYEIYPYMLGSKRMFSLAYNNSRVFGPVPDIRRVLEEYCLIADDFEPWTGESREKSVFGRPGRKRMNREEWAATNKADLREASHFGHPGVSLVA